MKLNIAREKLGAVQEQNFLADMRIKALEEKIAQLCAVLGC